MSPIDKERLDVAQAAVERLLHGLKGRGNLKGKAIQRMKLIESAVLKLELARIT